MSLFSDMKYFTSAELRLEVVKNLFQCVGGKIHFPQNTIHSKNVVDIVESGQRRRNSDRSSPGFLYVKRQLRRQPDAISIIVDRRSLKTAGRAAVDAELAEMIEIILQRRAAVLTETAFPDFA